MVREGQRIQLGQQANEFECGALPEVRVGGVRRAPFGGEHAPQRAFGADRETRLRRLAIDQDATRTHRQRCSGPCGRVGGAGAVLCCLFADDEQQADRHAPRPGRDAAQIIAAAILLASHEPRPDNRSPSTRGGIHGGTVSR
jgi:hypothetical protein